MFIQENNNPSLSTEEDIGSVQIKFNPKKSNANFIPKILKDVEENNSLNYSEETQYLKYDSSYQAVIPNNKNNTPRKSSTLSTNVSQSENGFDNLSPQKSSSNCSSSSLLNLGRERFASSPISNYYDGTDNYLKGLYPDKNDYQKSNNYLEKKIFFRDHYPSVDLNIIYRQKKKSISLDEQLKNQSTETISQSPQNLSKVEYPVCFFSFYGIDCKS